MTFLSILARLLGWFFRDIQPPEPARVRLPPQHRCYCGHAAFQHRDRTEGCLRCGCSYLEPSTAPRSIP